MTRQPIDTLRRGRHHRRGFSMAELLTVVGLIALLASLLLPVLAKVRAAANLRQMGTAWLMYTTENHGRLMDYVWNTPATPEAAWSGYWPGVLDGREVRGASLLCPAAAEASPDPTRKGYGAAAYAWSGKYASAGSVVRLNQTTYRDSSYGFNRYLTAGGGFGPDGSTTTQITVAKSLTDVPVFFDCAYADVRPVNGTEDAPVKSPPNLRGDQITLASPDHWKFLLARHGRSVNVYFADGSTRWTRLEETYGLDWKVDWVKYPLRLPSQ